MEKRIINKMIKAMKFKKTDVVLINFWGTMSQIEDLTAFSEEFASEDISCLTNDCTDEKLLELTASYPRGLPETWFNAFADVTAVVDLIDKPIGMPPEEGADIAAELGIGMNPMVEKTGADAALEEDALGTLHIAFGMNAMFGGKNACRFHMDFVTEGDIL